MKKLLLLLGLIFCASHAHATNCALTSGASQSTISSALTAAGSGSCTGTINVNTVAFAAGTYGPITSMVTIPCNANMTGPTVTYSQTPNQTAQIQGSTSNGNWGFQTTTGCGTFTNGLQNSMQTIQYLEWNGEWPTSNTSGGGGFLVATPGTTNLVVQYNWLHGVQGFNPGYNANLININNSNNTTAVSSNITIQWNIFGSTSLNDCYQTMTSSTTVPEDTNGFCNGVGIAGNTANIYVLNNIFSWLEQDMKLYEGAVPPGTGNSGMCNNLVTEYNAFSNEFRIGYETQCNQGTSSQPTLQYTEYNEFGNRLNPNTQNFDLSAANGCTDSSGNDNILTQYCATHNDNNVFVETLNCCDTGMEVWGTSQTYPPSTSNQFYTSATGNLFSGYLYESIHWAPSGSQIFNNNTFNVVLNGSYDTNCATATNSFFNPEDFPEYIPTCTGNTFSNAITGTYTSASPSVSPAGGSGPFSPGATITIGTSGTNRDTNTSNWCTTDGTTPVAGGSAVSGGNTAKIMTSYTLPGSGTVTLKCLGMWGAANQPYSYPTNYGYVPSSVATNVYPIGGGTTVAPPGVSVIVISEIPEQKIVTHADGPNGQNYRVAVVIPEQPVTVSVPTPCTSGLYMFQVIGNTLQPICWNIAPVGSTSLFVDGAGKWAARPTGVAW